ncbi:glycosyltransferase, partial [Priestia megaterium]|uniref:glycosyltransferase family 2 protein n=1 Tax=Priestia megaterium TaxID=1404 RepID=UPI0030099D36
MEAKLSIIIPTYNPGKLLQEIYQHIHPYLSEDLDNELIIVDSSSNDQSIEFLDLENKKIKFISIPKEEFNHGGTRNRAAEIATG